VCETFIPEKERTFLFPAVRIFTLRRSSRRMRTKTLTITTTTTMATKRGRTIRTNGKERTKKRTCIYIYIYIYIYTYVRTRMYVHAHVRACAIRSCHEFWMSKRLCRPSRRCTNYEWTSEWIQPVPTTPPPAGASLSSFFYSFYPYRRVSTSSLLSTVALSLYIFLLGIFAATPYDATNNALCSRNTVYYRFFRDAEDRGLSFAPIEITRYRDFNTVLLPRLLSFP